MNDARESETPSSASGADWALSAAGRAKADAFLDDQRELIRLQAEELRRENRLRHWSLRVRHVSDILKLAFEVAIVLIVLAIAVGIGAAIWSASRADGLVIESFQVPAAMAAHGLSGPVVANKLLDRLSLMQNATRSTRAASSFANDWTGAIKVEIPDTGVSLGDALRLLRNALGNETHLSGEVFDTTNGIALTVRLGDHPGQTFEGRSGDVDGIVHKAADAVFREAQPYRYSVFLADSGRYRESVELEEQLSRAGDRNERAWAFTGLAVGAEMEGQYARSLDYARHALAQNPDLPNPMNATSLVEMRRGHDEASLADSRRSLQLYRSAGTREVDAAAVPAAINFFEVRIAQLLGDYRTALQRRDAQVPVPGLINRELNLLISAADAARDHDLKSARARLADLPRVPNLSYGGAGWEGHARGLVALMASDWPTAIRDFEQSQADAHRMSMATGGHFSDRFAREVLAGPWLAYAQEMAGNRSAADAILRTLPLDCYVCTDIRGRVAAARSDRGAAAGWFADAIRQGPSLPFAYTDWGAMLLAKGDYDAAIAKFAIAHAKGPHFADSLEMWGETLMMKNRSDLALAKFKEANTYAPDWGRLHLEWGKALYYTGRKDEANEQFEAAARLDLSAEDAAALARWRVRA